MHIAEKIEFGNKLRWKTKTPKGNSVAWKTFLRPLRAFTCGNKVPLFSSNFRPVCSELLSFSAENRPFLKLM